MFFLIFLAVLFVASIIIGLVASYQQHKEITDAAARRAEEETRRHFDIK